MAFDVKLISENLDLDRCAGVMLQLRPHLTHAHFLAITRAAFAEGYQLARLEDAGQIMALAGFHIQHLLVAGGKNLYVDDLVTLEEARSQGYGHALLSWVLDYDASRAAFASHSIQASPIARRTASISAKASGFLRSTSV